MRAFGKGSFEFSHVGYTDLKSIGVWNDMLLIQRIAEGWSHAKNA